MGFKSVKGSFNRTGLIADFISGKFVGHSATEVFGKLAPRFSATGGTKFVYENSTYHIFIGSDDFIWSGIDGTVEVLIIAGGGSGAGGQGGGGGGAGIVYGTSISISDGTYPVVIGAGGASVINPVAYSSLGSKGSVSSFNSVTAIGGGGGIKNNNGYPNIPAPEQVLVIGANGGGGGGGSGPGAAGDGITPQPVPVDYTAYGGYAGAPQAVAPGGSGGGGGGAGGASPGPSPRPAGTASPGGDGAAFPSFPGPGMYNNSPSPLQSTLTTSWRDALGPTGLFGGGGGGGEDGPSGRGLGGPGGGGNGGDASNVSTGGVNYTGGGGGGVGQLGDVVPPYTSKGGDGIVIIKYSTS